MKKILILFIGLFMFNAVNAESLDISLANSNETNYFFDMLVKDVKDSKVNVISGVITYDQAVFKSFELGAQNGWDLQTVKDGNKVKFVLTHMTDYAVENQRIVGINTVVKKNSSDLKITLDSIVSSSSESAINVSNVTYKHEVVETPVVKPENNVQVPEEDVSNKVEEDKKEENKTEEKEEKKTSKKIKTRDVISLVISFLVLGAVIAVGLFAYKENKKDGGK